MWFFSCTLYSYIQNIPLWKMNPRNRSHKYECKVYDADFDGPFSTRFVEKLFKRETKSNVEIVFKFLLILVNNVYCVFILPVKLIIVSIAIASKNVLQSFYVFIIAYSHTRAELKLNVNTLNQRIAIPYIYSFCYVRLIVKMT